MGIAYKKVTILILVILSTILSGCGLPHTEELIINRYADALLTKNNEIQFRFKINNKIIEDKQLYKVRVTIHDEKLSEAVGKKEIIYGEENVRNGQLLEANEKGQKYIVMDPIPLNNDLHISQIKKMIEEKNAVSVEVFNDQEVLGKAYLTNFTSEL